MKPRIAGAVTALLAIAALGIAYFAQFVLLLVPCELCLWERWPYRIVILFGVLATLSPQRAGRFFLLLAAITLFAGAGIAFFHGGVEFHWWNSPLPECNGMLTPGAPLPATPARPCDAPVFLIPFLPISMAMMDFCGALAFALVLSAYVSRKPRRFR